MILDEPAFKRLYHVRVPMAYTYEEWELDTIGIPQNERCEYSYRTGSFNKRVYSPHKELCNCHLSLLRLIEIANEGGTIWFVNPKEIEEVFIIMEELIQKYENKPFELNARPDVNLDRTIGELKEFIRTVFDVNSITIKQRVENDASTNKFGLGNFIPKPASTVVESIKSVSIDEARNNRYRHIPLSPIN